MVHRAYKATMFVLRTKNTFEVSCVCVYVSVLNSIGPYTPVNFFVTSFGLHQVIFTARAIALQALY